MTDIEKYKREQYEKAKAGAQPTKPSSLQLISKYPSLCINCVWEVHPVMLTTYCLHSMRCDRCGKIGSLAITKEVKNEQ